MNGWTCVGCGRSATHCRLTRTPARGGGLSAHINLYDDHGLMFTHDHIEPLSKGGSNTIENSQTMCEQCNSIKADKTYNFNETLTIVSAETGEQIQGVVVGMSKNSVTLDKFEIRSKK